MDPVLALGNVDKRFTLHTQGGVVLDVVSGVDLSVLPGECVVLAGPSGTGKSTLLRILYANYRVSGGAVLVRHRGALVDLVKASPREIADIRRVTLGYVSQFLRVIPRVPALDIVAEPLIARGRHETDARAAAAAMLDRLNIPERLWGLAPATFSGGEQQRVNIARGFVAPYDALLLDEPTASLDKENREIVVGLIREALTRGTAIVGIFHDADVRAAVATRLVDVTAFAAAA